MDEAQTNNFLEALRTLVQSGKYDKAIQGCKALLAEQPAHPGATELLAEAERRKSTYQQSAGAPLVARQYACPSCGKPVSVKLDTTQALTCPNCRALISLESGAAAEVEGRRMNYLAPPSFLKLGLEGNLQGKKVQIIGRQYFDARIREWDTEDNDWWNGEWQWHEWMVVTEDKEYVFIEEDSEGYKVHRKFTPKKASIPPPDARTVALDDSGIKYSVLEHGSATLKFFEGEFTWVPSYGESVSYCDIDGPDGLYSIEWRSQAAGGEIEEVEFFSGTPTDKLALLHAFNLREEIEKEKASRAEQQEYNSWSLLAFATSGLLLLLGLVSLSGSPQLVFQHSASFAEIPEDGVTVGPFQLNQPGGIYRIKVSGSIPDNTDSWGGVELLDASEDAINTVEGDIWRESGSDDEGPWSESETEAVNYFRLDQPGVYYARMFVERPGATQGQLSVEISKGAVLSRYYFILALLMAGFGASLRRFKSANPVWIFLGILLLGSVILKRAKKAEIDD